MVSKDNLKHPLRRALCLHAALGDVLRDDVVIPAGAMNDFVMVATGVFSTRAVKDYRALMESNGLVRSVEGGVILLEDDSVARAALQLA